MKLHYYKPSDGSSNFGDELNKYLWEHYFPNFFDDDETQVFFGIGTILQAAKKFYPKSEIIVFGSGAINGEQKKEDNFTVKFVRGPLSAAALNDGNSAYITDPAILTPALYPAKNSEKKFTFSYIPHYSVANNSYRKAVERLGIKYIDPRDPIHEIIDAVNASETMICEAMHGAIVADSYRVPWIPVCSFQSFNTFKWNDWASSLGMTLEVQRLPRLFEGNSLSSRIKRKIFSLKLKKIMRTPSYVSDLETSEIAKEKVLKEINRFKEAYRVN